MKLLTEKKFKKFMSEAKAAGYQEGLEAANDLRELIKSEIAKGNVKAYTNDYVSMKDTTFDGTCIMLGNCSVQGQLVVSGNLTILNDFTLWTDKEIAGKFNFITKSGL